MTGKEGENTMSKNLINTTEPRVTQDKSEIYKANIIESMLPESFPFSCCILR